MRFQQTTSQSEFSLQFYEPKIRLSSLFQVHKLLITQRPNKSTKICTNEEFQLGNLSPCELSKYIWKHKEGLGALLTRIIAAHKPTRPTKSTQNYKSFYLHEQRLVV